MQTIEALSHRLSSYLEAPQINLVKRAYYYAEQAHDGQKRRSGEPYVVLHGKGAELFAVRGAAKLHLSLTHTENYAAATAILEG